MKIAIVGLGRMGRRHVQAARDLGAQIVGVADPLEENAKLAAQEHQLPANVVFRDAGELLRAVTPDCLVVASTAPSHAPLTIQAAEAGVKHVLCEKPMASSLAECDQMIEVCRRHGTKLAINHQMRVMEQYLEAKRMIEAPEFGGWSSINVIAGNFGIAMNGIHYFELFRWLTNELPAQVTAWFSREPVKSPRGPQFSDRAGQVYLATASGKRMYLEAGDDQGHGIRVVYAGRNGMLIADELGGRIEHVVRQPEHRELPTTRYGMPADTRQLEVAPADAVVPSKRVLDALLSGRDFPTGEDGRTALEVLVAAFVSAESSNAPVAFKPTALPRGRRFDYA
jgi:predicted dehydrogenase